jgi:hypothetical protein
MVVTLPYSELKFPKIPPPTYSSYFEFSIVDQAVMIPTQCDQIVRVVGAASPPVQDVVQVQIIEPFTTATTFIIITG